MKPKGWKKESSRHRKAYYKGKQRGMTIKEAERICEDYGWEITHGKYHLHSEDTGDSVAFYTDKGLIDYAKELKRNR